MWGASHLCNEEVTNHVTAIFSAVRSGERAGAACALAMTLGEGVSTSSRKADSTNQVLEWNQIFVDTLIVTNTPNSSSQRLGAIVHTAIFDAFNGIERRYTPIFVHDTAPRGASRRAAVIAAAYTTLAGLFPARQAALAEQYAASLAALSDDGRRWRSIARARHRMGDRSR